MQRLQVGEIRTTHSGSLRDTVAQQRPWIAVLLVINFLDMATTALGLHLGLPEGNPIQASILASEGELPMFFSKIVLVAGLVLLLHVLRARYRRLWPFGLAMTIPTLLVVVNNLIWVVHALT